MFHVMVKLAEKIMDNKENYSEVLIKNAHNIISWNKL